MNFMKVKNIKRIACLVLVIVLSMAALSSCAEIVRDPIMECEGQKISLEMYEFMLSRMKGSLARQGIDTSSTSEFWGEMHGDTGLTNEQYYNKAVIDTCKNYLAALIIFEEEGMTLPQTTIDAIDEEISFYIEYDGDGDEEKLDLILQKYGTTTEGLRRIYEIEAKYNAVVSALYGSGASQIAGNVKDEYYKENYYRFKQILVANFYYKDEVDENGDTVYFNPETGKPIYDSKGSYQYDEKEQRVLDEYGVAIRFAEDGKTRLYDTEKGKPAPEKDASGHAVEYYYTNEEMAEREAKARELAESIGKGNFSAFEAEMPNWELYAGAEEYCPEGYYLSDIEAGAYDDTMKAILASLKEMQVGEVRNVESLNGYHLVMKYALDAGKYENSEYAQWFYEFDSSLTSKLFRDKCGKYFEKIELNDDNIAKAKSIKFVGQNYDY